MKTYEYFLIQVAVKCFPSVLLLKFACGTERYYYVIMEMPFRPEPCAHACCR